MKSTATGLKRRWPLFTFALIVFLVAAIGVATHNTWLPAAKALLVGPDKASEGDAAEGDDHEGHGHAGHDEGNSLELSDVARRNIGLRTAVVKPSTYVKTVSVPAIVVERSGRSQVDITAPLTGRVTRVYPIEGEATQPGQPLFELRLTHEDLVIAQRDFLRSTQEADVVKREIARLESIGEGLIVGRRVLEHKYELEKIEAGLHAQRQGLLLHGLTEEQIDAIIAKRTLLQSLTVTAPPFAEDGEHLDANHIYHVQRILVKRGQHVSVGSVLGTLADHCILYVEGQAFEDDAQRLTQVAREGLAVDVAPVANGKDRSHTEQLKVLYVADQVDPESRALRFYLVLPNQLLRDKQESRHRFVAWQYRPGQRMEVKIPVGQPWANQIVLPPEAVVDEGAEAFVFEQNGDHFDRVAIHVIYRDKDAIVIENDGTLNGSTLAMTGAYQMHLAIKNKAGGGIDPHAGHSHQGKLAAMLSGLLNGIIRFALHNRMLVAAIATFLLLYGAWQISHLPIDVFPDLNRPRVVVMTEAPGLAPEEVETLVTFPLETALNGATGVQAVRTSSGVGISVVYVEFDWGTDIYNDRQIVAERLALASGHLPEGVKPQLAPISSIMGQIIVAGMYSQPNEQTLLFKTGAEVFDELNAGDVPGALREAFLQNKAYLSSDVTLAVERFATRWSISDAETGRWFSLINTDDGIEVHRTTSPMQLRTLADWVVRQQLLTIPGVSQVFVMGGERKQFQVLVNPDQLLKFGVTLHEVKTAVANSNQNATGGYLDEQGPNEFLVRALGRVQTVRQLEDVVVKHRDGRSILLGQVAQVVEGPQVKRGDSAAYVRDDTGTFAGGPAVALTINKQPGADTREVTDQIAATLANLEGRLPKDVRIESHLYQQKAFIDLAIENVVEALRDGGILVVIVLFIFLLNFRTTFITLTAIPLSIVITGLVFKAFGLSINTMTLGGLAVAIGELVDDAIVDVENIFRRLRENRVRSNPKPPLLVVFQASVEIRNSIVFGTMIVVLVFIPLFALGGMEGRLFMPLGVAYIVSILSSLVVSLTVTPVLSYWLLARRRIWPWLAAVLSPLVGLVMTRWLLPSVLSMLGLDNLAELFFGLPIWIHIAISLVAAPVLWAIAMATELFFKHEDDGLVLRAFKLVAGWVIRGSLRAPALILSLAMCAVGIAGVAAWRLESDFLPPFDEGAVQINVLMPPGTSLQKSNEVATIADQQLQEIEDIRTMVRRTGRAELDEHAEGVNLSEIVASIDPDSSRDRETILDDIRERLAAIPGIVISVEQPLAHLISHMLSGVKAQVAIKLYGDDLNVLRRKASEIKTAISDVSGVKDLQVEPQVTIPQLRIEIDGHQLKQYGLTRGDLTEFVETAMNGEVVSEILVGQRKFDLLVRLDEPYREDLETLTRLTIHLPGGGTTKLGSVADIYRGGGPNTINREQVRRRIVIQCNVGDRGLVDVVQDIKQKLGPIERSLPESYMVEYGGQFESQQSASRMIAILFAISLTGMFLVLYSMFRSANLALQVMVALPMAFIGSVAALYLTGQTMSVAAMVGFISLCGIASRNGILLINHYLHLVKYEGESWSRDMIVRAGKERLAPVLMTALTSGIGLVPLAMAAGEPGKEILYPVATVIIGGLVSSTLLEFLVRPVLFWLFGMRSARRITEEEQQAVDLIEESLEHTEGGPQPAMST